MRQVGVQELFLMEVEENDTYSIKQFAIQPLTTSVPYLELLEGIFSRLPVSGRFGVGLQQRLLGLLSTSQGSSLSQGVPLEGSRWGMKIRFIRDT